MLMIGIHLLVSALVVVLTMAATFAISVRRGRHDTIDTTWGLGFAAIAVVGLFLADGSPLVRVVLTALTVIWGVRLAVHLHTRNSGHGEDPRYVAIRARAKGSPSLHLVTRVYLPQAAIMYFVSLPVQLGQHGSLSVLGWFGIALWLIGFGFESIGDAQLRRFRADPADKGTVLDTGLWRYTRHPNYFGDACVWWGLYLLGASTLPGALMVLSPIAMTWLLAYGTGKSLLEKSIDERRPGYVDYVRKTSGFFPLPPKKSRKEAA